MSLPLWSKHDAEMYRGLSLFREELEGQFLTPDEFRSSFRDLHGRPVQDIVEALYRYGKSEYFKYEIVLKVGYINHGKALAKITAALNELQSEPKSPPNAYNGLSEPVHAKVLAVHPLTVAEARSLPDEARSYLGFKLSDINRQQLREDLTIYDSNEFIQPSRLVKSTQSKPTLSLDDIIIEPERYDKDTGILHLASFYYIAIAGKSGVKRPNGLKYLQCRIMDCLFKSEVTLNGGVKISTILGVHERNVDKSTTKKIANAVAEINKKATKVSGLENLLMIDGKKVKIGRYHL